MTQITTSKMIANKGINRKKNGSRLSNIRRQGSIIL